ncbi:MAG: DNA polymerase III subunit beta [bacterium]|nr:DNA polymerase III subunit beta [bacterium]
MKFSVSCSDLKSGMQQIINVIPSKTTLPILGHVLFEAKEGVLSLSGTDLEVTLNTKIPATIELEGAVTISGRLLFDVIREIGDIPLEISVDESNKVLLKYSRGQYTFFGEDPKDFPQLPSINVKHEIKYSNIKLKRLIEKTLFAVSTDELRAALMGILFQVKENECRAVSTDGHRLSRIIDQSFTSAEELNDVIIPTKALNLLSKGLEEEGEGKISLAENHIVFELENVIISATLIEGRYPDYEKVIPHNNEKVLRVNREQVISALRTVSVLANKITQQVRLKIASNNLTISSQDMDRGEGFESLEAEYSGENIEIGFNSNYLIEILKHIDTENVLFHFDSSTSAALLFPENQLENEDLLMLVMPIKLRD